MLPPMGAIIVGPCPECRGLVAIFCGQALALDKNLMVHGSFEARRSHLMEVISEYLKGRVTELLSEDGDMSRESSESAPAKPVRHHHHHRAKQHGMSKSSTLEKPPITQDEMDVFRRDEINLLDNGEWFRAIFG